MKQIETYEDLLNCSFNEIKEYIKHSLSIEERYKINCLILKAKQEFNKLEEQLINCNPLIIKENDNELLKDKFQRYTEALQKQIERKNKK